MNWLYFILNLEDAIQVIGQVWKREEEFHSSRSKFTIITDGNETIVWTTDPWGALSFKRMLEEQNIPHKPRHYLPSGSYAPAEELSLMRS